jgi:hypothetical protein
MRILVTGGTGFLGSHLCPLLLRHGHQLTVLSRRPESVGKRFGAGVEAWRSLAQWQPADRFDAVINLAGEPIIDRPWTAARRQALLASRIGVTEQLVMAMQRAEHKPAVLLSGSAVGIYGDAGTDPCPESHPAAHDFGAQLCSRWEQAALRAEALGVRVVLLRTGLVLHGRGGMLKKMRLPFRFGFGSRLGDGRQMMSWVHLQDYLNAVLFLLDGGQCRGAYNMTAPNPVSNAEFTQTLAKSVHRRAVLAAPAFLLKPLLGQRSVLLLGGQSAPPANLLRQGFRFQFPYLSDALKNIG